MKLTLLIVFFYFPISASIKCYVDSQENGQKHNDNFTTVECSADCEFCGKRRTRLSTYGHQSSQLKSAWACGCGSFSPVVTTAICQEEGEFKMETDDLQDHLFCCKSDYCNSSTISSSFFVYFFTLLCFFAIL